MRDYYRTILGVSEGTSVEDELSGEGTTGMWVVLSPRLGT